MSFLQKLTAGKPPGYIPVSPFIHVNFINSFYAAAKNGGQCDPVMCTPDVYRHFGFDVIHRNCTPSFDFVDREGADWSISKQSEESDDTSRTDWEIKTPGGRLYQVWHTTQISPYDAESSPTEYLIKSARDFHLCREFMPPPLRVDLDPIIRAKAAVGESGVVAPWVQGVFNFVAFYFCKLDTLLTIALTDEPLYRDMMEFFLTMNIEYIDRVLDAEPDLLSYGGNIAGGTVVGPDFFRTFIAEYETRLINHIQSRGAGVLYHNCGKAAHLLPIYAEMGLAAYESLTPSPHGDTDLSAVLGLFPEQTVLLGNIDQIELLMTGPPRKIHDEVKNVVQQVRKLNRSHAFVMATTDYIHEDTPHEHIFALSRASRELNGL